VWEWDIDRIHAKNYTDNVVDLMVRKLKRLSITTQDALKHLACLGNMAEISTLALIQSDTAEAAHEKLWEAVHAGLVILQGHVYQFLHDRIQQSAYSLLPEDGRPAVHLRIGRKLLANMAADELTEQLFEVANQFNRGAALIVDRDEKTRVATINLHAGRKAKASAAYASARAYLASGMALVDERDWSSQYELTFNLWLEHAQCELLYGNLEKTEQLIAELLQRAASKVDQAAVYDLNVRLHTVQGEYPQALDNALACLRLFGIDLPAHPSWDEVEAEYETIWRNLDGRSIETLIDLPRMTDPELQAAMQVFSILAEISWFTEFHLHCMLACRMLNISMQHGMSGPSAHAYACFGALLGPVFHRYREGYRLGRLACDLVEKHDFSAYHTKVHHEMGAISVWTQPITKAIELRRAVARIATETGDLTYACYDMHQTITGLLLRNDPLDAVWRESEMALNFARTAKFRDVADLIVSQQRFIATMQGRTATFSTFSDAQFDEATFEAQLTGDRMNTMMCLYWILKLKARFLSGDYADALAAAGKAKPLLRGEGAQIFLLDYSYYTALAVAALYENASADEQADSRVLLTAHRGQLREWAENYPPTFGDKHALVSGEIARLEGRDAEAMRLYEQAIKSAREHGFVQNEGLAHEVAAGFYAARGAESIAYSYLRYARDCYLRWGALGKVRQLDQRHPWLRGETAPSALSATVSAPVEQLDVGSVVKASQAVSSEIELGKLIETLMRISLEHAGAERGLLILFTGNEPRIAAEATTGGGDIEVMLRNSEVTPTELSESVLHTAVRTRDSVILDDASAHAPFSADAYVRQKQARSVLCLPLVKQAKLVGAMYLENNLAPRVFTSAKLAVLQLLASQAAISLQNVQLYDELRRSEAYLAEAQNLSHTGSFSWNTVSGRVYWSNETFRILEYDRSTVPSIELLMHDRVHPEDAASLRQAIKRASRTAEGVSQEFRLCLPDGRVKHILAVAQGACNESGETELLGAVMDITATKQAEEKIRRSERELRVTINTLPAFVLRSQPDGAVDFVSQSILDYSGLSEDAWVGRGWIDSVHPEDAERGLIEWSAAVAHGAALGMELRFRRADGHYRWFESRSVPLRDESGDIVKWYWTIHDIDDRKRVEAEKERLRDQLRQSQKMEAIGTLAGGIAHDFNNILGAILGYGELAQQAVPAHSDVHRYVKNVMQAGGRAKALVERILAFSRRGTSEIGPINVQAVVHETLELLEAASLAPSVQIARHLDAADSAIIGDATQLHQVVMNLCTNALQAMENGGLLEVNLDRAYVTQGIKLSHGAVATGSFVRLSVADTGGGIPERVLDRMFDPFFTTKSVGEGTGLGLSLVHSAVADLGGAIDVRTVIGNGTTFTIWLPRAGEVVASSAEPAARLPRGNGETVLVIDNEKALVALAEEILAELGYEPIGFSSSIVALGTIRESPQRFDIVLTDEWMPELVGTDLAREIVRLRPDLPIVLMSGYGGAQLRERAHDAGIRELLRKPLQRKDIAECFRRVLHGSADS
jgi:PAS domain S-box-containing protein